MAQAEPGTPRRARSKVAQPQGGNGSVGDAPAATPAATKPRATRRRSTDGAARPAADDLPERPRPIATGARDELEVIRHAGRKIRGFNRGLISRDQLERGGAAPDRRRPGKTRFGVLAGDRLPGAVAVRLQRPETHFALEAGPEEQLAGLRRDGVGHRDERNQRNGDRA